MQNLVKKFFLLFFFFFFFFIAFFFLLFFCFKGLLSVSQKGEVRQLCSETDDGIPLIFTDFLDIDNDGIIYFSDASTYSIHEMLDGILIFKSLFLSFLILKPLFLKKKLRTSYWCANWKNNQI